MILFEQIILLLEPMKWLENQQICIVNKKNFKSMRLQKSKLLQFFFALFLSVWSFNFQSYNGIVAEVDQQKMAAFEVLKTRCNTCHITQNPAKVFTLENMDGFAKRINRQVFFFKRMPKGRDRRKEMKPEEYQTLKNWINQVKSLRK